MIRAVIIDDERKAIDSLRTDLGWYCSQDVEIVGDAQNLREGLELLQQTQPQLLFLDVEIGQENGFMLLQRLKDLDLQIQVIFTTAHSGYTLQALRGKAFDYLLKPIDPDDLRAAVQRLKQTLAEASPSTTHNGQPPRPTTIALPLQDQIRICKLADIVRCESESNYTRFFFTDKSALLISKNLGSFEGQLLENGFFRSHKSHIINLQHVSGYMRQDGGAVKMMDGSEVPVARNSRPRLFELLGMSQA